MKKKMKMSKEQKMDKVRKKKLEEMVTALISNNTKGASAALKEYLSSKTRSLVLREEYEDFEERPESDFEFSDEEGMDDELSDEEGMGDEDMGDAEDMEFGDEEGMGDEDMEFGDEEGMDDEFSDEEGMGEEGINLDGEDEFSFGAERRGPRPPVTEGMKTKVGKIKYSGKGSKKSRMKKHSNAAPHLGTGTKKIKFGTGKPRNKR
jgi:hypothetical protein